MKIGERLLGSGAITKDQLSIVLREQRKSSHLRFGDIAIELNFLKEKELIKTLENIYCMESIDFNELLFNLNNIELLPKNVAFECLAVVINSDPIKIVIDDPNNILIKDRLKYFFKNPLKTEFAVSAKKQILRTLNYYYSENPNRCLANKILLNAIDSGASDIHFEPNASFVDIRTRIDGILSNNQILHIENWSRICSKLKVLADLNIAEHRKPQSGHVQLKVQERYVDLRISTHPSIHGEAIVIRILDSKRSLLNLNHLGMDKNTVNCLKEIIKSPHGLILVAGPTGSGKTTTLYAILKEINPSKVNIMTLEDPIEYQIPGIRQLDLKEEGILSFAEGVKSILRQDPDVVLIGEIRDEATANMAMRAALTGKLVLATVHAKNAYGVIARMENFGVKKEELIQVLLASLSQRLFKTKSLTEKGNSRIAIAEVIKVNKLIQEKILKEQSITKNFINIRENAEKHAASGIISQEELIRIIGTEDF